MRPGPRSVLELMGVGARSVRKVGNDVNANWVVATDGDRFVLRRSMPERSMAQVRYEVAVIDHVRRAGWPVAEVPLEPIQAWGHVWTLFTHLPGRKPSPRTPAGVRAEQRARGRLLASLHLDLAGLTHLGQREDWHRAEDSLDADPPLEDLLNRFARHSPDEAAVLRRHGLRARELFEELGAAQRPAIVLHGDLTPWNLMYRSGELTGIIDWDFTHLDHRVSDFAMAWRGHHDEVVHGYMEESPIDSGELALMTPVWWSWVLTYARLLLLRAGEAPPDQREFGWVMTHVVRRSPLTRE